MTNQLAFQLPISHDIPLANWFASIEISKKNPANHFGHQISKQKKYIFLIKN